MKTTTKTQQADRATYRFADSKIAWKFYRYCEGTPVTAGFPELREPTVQVLIRTWMDREFCDSFTRVHGGEVVDYAFAGKAVQS